MLQKCSICFCLLVTAEWIKAEWIKIPVLDPQKSTDTPNQYSYLSGSRSIPKVNTLAPLSRLSSSIHTKVNPSSTSEIISFKNKPDLTGQVQSNVLKSQNVNISNLTNQPHIDNMPEESTEIDTNFLQSVMNNSQKADRIGVKNASAESKFTPFLEIMKNVHRTLLVETPTTIVGKMKFLQDLQVKLYSYIKPRIKRLWNTEERQARTDKAMGFPSMDGALLTICFLLFAVFLIKLVKQLIQQLQDKANANALMMTGATPMSPAGTTTGRRKRSLSSDVYAAAHILHLIESFHVQYNKLAAAQ